MAPTWIIWDSEGVVLVDFLEGKKLLQTLIITYYYYVEVLKKLRAKLAKKRPGKLHRRILFHHDNAPAHFSWIVREFRWELLPHPPYRPDLAPSEFFYIPKTQSTLESRPF